MSALPEFDEAASRRLVAETLRGLRQQLMVERLALDASQVDVAAAMGTRCDTAISEYERGRRVPGVPALVRWAAALGKRVILVPMEIEEGEIDDDAPGDQAEGDASDDGAGGDERPG